MHTRVFLLRRAGCQQMSPISSSKSNRAERWFLNFSLLQQGRRCYQKVFAEKCFHFVNKKDPFLPWPRWNSLFLQCPLTEGFGQITHVSTFIYQFPGQVLERSIFHWFRHSKMRENNGELALIFSCGSQSSGPFAPHGEEHQQTTECSQTPAPSPLPLAHPLHLRKQFCRANARSC